MKKTLLIIPLLLLTACTASPDPPPTEEPRETIIKEAPFYQGESVHVAPLELEEINIDDWKAFSNTEYKYAFKFPDAYLVKSNDHRIDTTIVRDIGVFSENNKQIFHVLAQDPKIFNEPSLKEFAEKTWKINRENDNPYISSEISDMSQARVGGKTAYQFNLRGVFTFFAGNFDTPGGETGTGKNDLYVITASSDQKFIIIIDTDDMIAQKILETFTFVE